MAVVELGRPQEQRESPWIIPATQQQLDVFTIPHFPRNDEQMLLDRFRKTLDETDERYSRALVIMRMQPLHFGHIFLMKQALITSSSLIIGIGSSQTHNEDNPWSAPMRRERLERTVDALGITPRIADIVYLPDFEKDDEWVKHAQDSTKLNRDTDVVVGNNGWVNQIFEEEGFTVRTTPFYHREAYKGKTIREFLRNGRRFSESC